MNTTPFPNSAFWTAGLQETLGPKGRSKVCDLSPQDPVWVLILNSHQGR